jgi:hypothetical protein
MSVSEDPGVIDGVTRTLQIIIFALVMGLVFFLGIVVFLRLQVKPGALPAAAAAPALPVITVVAFTVAATLVPLSLLLPRLVSDSACKKLAAGAWAPPQKRAGDPASTGDVASLAQIYVSQKIVGAALNEGPAFLALIAYMIEGNLAALALAVALIVGVALRFPQRAAVEQWIDDRLVRLQMDRQSAGLG